MTNIGSPQPSSNKQSLNQSRTMFLTGIVILAIGITATLIIYASVFLWQVLTLTIGFTLSLLVVLINSRIGTSENRFSDKAFPLIVFFIYGTASIFSSGSDILLLINGVILLLILFSNLRPKNQLIWGIYLIAFAFLAISSDSIYFTDSIDTADFPTFQLALLVIAAIQLLYWIWNLITTFQSRSIRIRLTVVFVLLSIIPGSIAVASTSLLSFRTGREQAANLLDTVAVAKISQIRSWINAQEISLENTLRVGSSADAFYRIIGSPLSALSRESAYNLVLADLNFTVDQTREFTTIYVTDTLGEVIISTDEAMEGQSIAGTDHFINGVNSFYVGQPSVSNTGEIVWIMSLPLQTDTGITIGTINGHANLGAINALMADRSKLGRSGEIYLISSEGYLLTHISQDITQIPGQSIIETSGVEILLSSHQDGSADYTNYAGNQVIGVFHWLPDIQAGLITEQDQFEAFQTLRDNTFANIVVSSITVLLTSGVALLVSQFLSTPLVDLAATAKKVAEGKLDQFEIIDRNDEIGQISSSLNEMTTQLNSTLGNLENLVQERTQDLERRARYLEASAEVGRASTEFMRLEELLKTTTQLINEKFGFYHIGIFLIDDAGEFAVLKAANSEGGWRMLARAHRLRVGQQGIVGFVTGTGESRVLQKVGDDEVHFDNPDLPETRSELALPLLSAGEILGALDVQSLKENAFSEEDVSVLQVLADQVAISIKNTKLIEQLQSRLDAERRIFGDIEHQSWSAYSNILEGQAGIRSLKTGTVPIDIRETFNKPISPTVKMGEIAQREVSSPDGNHYIMEVPVMASGNRILAVFECKKEHAQGNWTDEEFEILESISKQFSITLENARLFAETQNLAQRERMVTDITGKVWSSSNIDTILKTTVQELSRALDVSQGNIRLQVQREQKADNPQEDTE